MCLLLDSENLIPSIQREFLYARWLAELGILY